MPKIKQIETAVTRLKDWSNNGKSVEWLIFIHWMFHSVTDLTASSPTHWHDGSLTDLLPHWLNCLPFSWPSVLLSASGTSHWLTDLFEWLTQRLANTLFSDYPLTYLNHCWLTHWLEGSTHSTTYYSLIFFVIPSLSCSWMTHMFTHLLIGQTCCAVLLTLCGTY